MAQKPDRRLSLSAPCLDFQKIESSEVTLDRQARQRVRRVCMEFLSAAIRYNDNPPFDAATGKRAAHTIRRKAVTARAALGDLVFCLFDAAMHEFTLAERTGADGFVLLLKRAIEIVGNVETAAERRVCEAHARGRPELRCFKKLVTELYCVFRASGGEGHIVWDKKRKCYKGYPLFFVRRVLEQVRPFVPVASVRKLLPSRDSAITRTATEAIRMLERGGQETPKNEGTVGCISASRRIRHQIQRGDTVRS